MEFYKAVLATNQIGSDGKRFTDEALMQLAKEIVGKVMTRDVDNNTIASMGRVVFAEYREGRVDVVVAMEEPRSPY